ncbi:HrcA family transcriptional regulator [Mycoplasmoides gallisepticum]|uniref:Heat-inducible transcription repressor HrcA n=6 Tax=Mycoplasmoides gallisepticum TaxID=2096 RepID=HRCA_MYCGA|nr:heat-inducible transcriptional repressor HrcA [Mycoplasmoides gallisepticum]Q7NBC5.2 RecName: Full=Heat-inducible transcription repressor HrcA [Mycoplasmoides gallisepticum str. R(low)]OBU78807.1 HrcA family transcriptional regulator [Mycoplasmoides gallisepticum]OBU79425.1 HrcA family transcriptional regulator [Mycoplasmoides gallisepticum]OBU80065.1 HrcA family transcriptional regulator [Mycoplasmoides gallisepticum]OBU81082.1 HrcA family transcriptional regulator [Mycoplasmoides gallisep
MNNKLTERQILILKAIINEYISTATAVGSKIILEKYFNNEVSSATIRNEMSVLEKEKYIEKPHTSAGRIPTIKGYQYYEANLAETKISERLKQKLMAILNKRYHSIDEVIEQSVEFINNVTNLPSVITKFKSYDLLKRMDLIKINNNTAIILIVSSSGEVIKKTIKYQNSIQYNDVSTCVQIFNDRLVDTPFIELKEKLTAIKEIVRTKVHEYEFVMQRIVNYIFDINEKSTINIKGTKKLVIHPEFHDHNKLSEILNLLENTSIWEQISFMQQKTGKSVITFGQDIGIEGISVASTLIETEQNKHQIAIVGPNRMEYGKIKGLLNILKEQVEKIDHLNLPLEEINKES